MNLLHCSRYVLTLGVMGLAASAAHASYTYSTGLIITSVLGSGGVIVNTPGTGSTFTSTNGSVVTLSDIAAAGGLAVPSTTTINTGKISASTTSTTADSFTINYQEFVSINNNSATPGSGTLTINGTLTVAGLDSIGGVSAGSISNQYAATTVGPTTVGGNSFTIGLGNGSANVLFAPPTINNANAPGSFGAIVTSAVPEPTSAAAFVVAGLGILARRRR